MHDAWADVDTEVAKRSRTQTRRRLIEAAPRVFVERGIGGASVAQICSAAGFTRGAFYSNFESKEELAAAIYVDHVDGLVELLSHRVVEQLESGMAIGRILREVFDAIAGVSNGSDWHLFRLEMHLASRRSEQMRRVVEDQYERLLGAAEEALGHAQAHGVRLQLPVDVLARLFVAVRDGEEMRVQAPVGDSLLHPVWDAFTIIPSDDQRMSRA